MNIKRFAFRPDTIVEIEEQRLQLQNLVLGTWNCLDLNTGLNTTITAADLRKAYEEKTIKILSSMPGYFQAQEVSYQSSLSLDLLSPKIQEKARARYKLLEAMRQKYQSIAPASELHHEIARHWGLGSKPSIRSVQRWWKSWVNSNFSILSLVDRTSYKGNRDTKIHTELEKICLDTLNKHYLTLARDTFKNTLGYCRNSVSKENHGRHPDDLIPIPTQQTLRSVLGSIDPYAVYAARHGSDAAHAKFRRAMGSKLADAPLERIEIDHTRLNLMVVDPTTGLVVGRPWFSVAIDYASRCIVGFHLSMETPSSATLAKLLIKIISPKETLQAQYKEMKHAWNMHGIPRLIAVDNGFEFHSANFKDACHQLGIPIQYMPRKTPWWKARIERAVGTINNHISSLMPGGQTFRSIQDKGDANPNKTACMTLEMMEKLTTIWISDYYHQNQHRGIRTTPQYAWDSKVDVTTIEMLEDLTVLNAICGDIAHRKLFHYGIEINSIRYNSPELTQLHHQGVKAVTIRWNREDLSSVIVYTKNGRHIEARAVYDYEMLKGVSLMLYMSARQDLINRKLDKNNREELDATLASIKTMAMESAIVAKTIKRRHVSAKRKEKVVSEPTPVAQATRPAALPEISPSRRTFETVDLGA